MRRGPHARKAMRVDGRVRRGEANSFMRDNWEFSFIANLLLNCNNKRKLHENSSYKNRKTIDFNFPF